MSRASSKLARVGLVIEAEILALGEGLCIASRFVLQQPHGIGFSDSMGILWELQTMEIRFVIVQNC